MDTLLIIYNRMRAPFLATPDADKAREYRIHLQEDGSWPDVNYAGTRTTSWEPATHLRRLLSLTQAWFSPDSPEHGNRNLASDISRALDYWLHKDPRRPWWWDCIGAPNMLSHVMLLFEEQLTDFQKTKGIDILSRAKLGATGQNLVWQAEITARRAALERDVELLRRAFELIASEIKISGEEGIQADFSFHQHGHCLYNHGYGANFAVDTARLAAMANGTACAYPDEKIALISAYILDGSQWLMRGQHPDFGAQGREITRPDQTAAYLGKAANHMLETNTKRKQEFKALIARLAGRQAQPLTGNKHFYRSDIMVHHRPGWYMSARMYSERTENTDGLSGCEEGLLSHYIADGATCIMRHGREYLNIFPVWDWQRIPGTTVELAPHQPGEPRRKTSSSFAGGVSDGIAGTAAFHLERDSMRARKAWFFFTDMAVCLGAGISCDSDNEVVTTLNQCLLTGPIHVGGSDGEIKTPEADTRTLDVNWAWHDSTGYLFAKTTPVTLGALAHTGNWQRISAQRPADTITEKIFTMGLTHGVKPEDADYAYAVVPERDAQTMPELAKKPPFKIAANSSNVQAVCHVDDKALGIVFHEPGKFEWEGWRVAVDRPCALLIRYTNDSLIAVSDPRALGGTLKLDISTPDGQNSTTEVKLPDGLHAGKSEIIHL